MVRKGNQALILSDNLLNKEVKDSALVSFKKDLHIFKQNYEKKQKTNRHI